MNFIDLCAGIGGFSLGLETAGMRCVGQVEIDDWCTEILEKHWPGVPRWRDVKIIAPADLPSVELICGGYPCQPFSHAGKRRGQEDDRHLWPYILPLIGELRPAWCLFENVAGHVTLGLDRVLSDLEGLGYATQALVVPACAIGSPQGRDRIWVLSHADSGGRERRVNEKLSPKKKRRRNAARSSLLPASRSWIPERYALPTSRLCRGVDGIPRRVDRIRGLGNAVAPRLVYEFGRAIMSANIGEGC